MTHTLNTIIDWIEANIFTQEDYDALPQETRDLHAQAVEKEAEWNLECARIDAEIEAEAERARLQAIWDANDAGSSESPSGTW